MVKHIGIQSFGAFNIRICFDIRIFAEFIEFI